MRHQVINLENQSSIHVFDDVFSLRFRDHAYNFCRRSRFTLGWADTTNPEQSRYAEQFYSKYSQEDVDRLGILRELSNTAVMDLVSQREFKFAVLNCGVACDSYFVHSHPESMVILYYVNMTWQDGFHGETQFYSEDLKSITWSTPYTPGRVVVFDGHTPHTIRPQSVIGPKHRFTFALFYH